MFGRLWFMAWRGRGSWRRESVHLLARLQEELLLFFLSQLGPGDGADECSYEQ
jgi:hypothetical protein